MCSMLKAANKMFQVQENYDIACNLETSLFADHKEDVEAICG